MHVFLWQSLDDLGVVKREDFNAWNLDPLRTKLFKNAPKSKKVYRLAASRVKDSTGGTATMKSSSSTDDFMSADERSAALKAYLDGGDNCTSLIVWWLHDDGRGFLPPKGLRTVVGPVRSQHEVNEVILSSRANGASADYVFDQLRRMDPEGELAE